MPVIVRLEEIRRLTAYGLFGILGVILDFSIFFWLSTWGVSIAWANAVGYFLGTAASFFLNAKYNFGLQTQLLSRASLYFSFALVGASGSSILLAYVSSTVALEGWLLKAFVMAPFLGGQYLANRFITFGRS